MLSAATTSPLAPRTGAATAAKPGLELVDRDGEAVEPHALELGSQHDRVGDRPGCVCS